MLYETGKKAYPAEGIPELSPGAWSQQRTALRLSPSLQGGALATVGIDFGQPGAQQVIRFLILARIGFRCASGALFCLFKALA
jgi:hypothetical protein